MSKIKLYYNSDCSDCVKLSMRTKSLDWLRNVELSTDTPATGELDAGEIAVYENKTKKWFTGIYAVRKVCMYVPAYFFYGLLLYIPPIKKITNKSKVGCNGDYCDIAK